MLAWRALMELHPCVVDALERHLQSGGAVALDWYEVLRRLSRAPGASMRMQDLAGVLLLSRSGVTRLADRLETAGLIGRRTCPADRRGTLAVLTDAGREALASAGPMVYEALQEHFARHLTRADARALLPILEHVLQAERCSAGSAAPAAPQRTTSNRRELVR
ncbi:MAG: MarR family transcriptional regulator [Dehalococcoidia bacterium]|nr:MAG: MarR family transcriptional regulator [Dehalococcoidia bacterium]